MSEEKQRIADVLKKAIKGEQDGYKFYNLLVEKADNPDARRKLENLRDDEVRHEKVLIDIYHRVVGPDLGQLPKRGINALAEVFEKGRVEKRRTEMEFIDLAIDAELAATKYYQQEHEACSDPEFRKVFDRLAEEEHTHYELLKAERDALTGGYHWFSFDSGAPLED